MLQVVLGAVPAGGDTIDLQNMSAYTEGEFDADALCRLFGQSHANQGEQWYDNDGSLTKQNDVILPDTSTDNYQVKWDALTGDVPSTVSTPEGVWESLDLDHFDVEWNSTGNEDISGSVTVSIRLGTGSTLDTAIWDGQAVSTKTET